MGLRNVGKYFEEDIKNSVPENLFIYRLKDGTASFGGSTSTRFQCSNICDYIVFDEKWLHLWELKSHKGASIPCSPIEYHKTGKREGQAKKYGVIRADQLHGLMQEYDKKNVQPGFIFNFSEKQRTYFVSVEDVYREIVVDGKKSLSIDWCHKYGTAIPQSKKPRAVVHWQYDLSVLLDNK